MAAFLKLHKTVQYTCVCDVYKLLVTYIDTLYLIVLVEGLYLQQVDLSMFREQLLNHITSNFYQEGFATTKSRLRLHLQRLKPPDLFLLQDQPLLLCYQLLAHLIKGKFFESSSIYFQSFKLETKELFSNTMLAAPIIILKLRIEFSTLLFKCTPTSRKLRTEVVLESLSAKVENGQRTF